MNEKIKEFLEEKKEIGRKNIDEEKARTLINLGLYEKVYSPENEYSAEYPFSEWDSVSSTTKYFKKLAYEITDEEYEEVKKYSQSSNEFFYSENAISKALTIIAWVIFIGGFIAGLALGNVEVTKGVYYRYTDTEFSFAIAFTYWCVSLISGTMFLGFAEIIKLLEEIKNKK